ncbi:MAG: hypothetical protein WA417_09790, partial [Stellaceae bacterium]
IESPNPRSFRQSRKGGRLRRDTPNPAQVNEAVDRPQQMRLGHVTFERELVEQGILMDLPFPHHRLPPGHRDLSKSSSYTTILQEFFNNIAPKLTFADEPQIGRAGWIVLKNSAAGG